MRHGFDQQLLQAHDRTEPWRCAYVGGTFDVLHRGHLALLANVRKIAHRTCVSVNTDEFAARYKRAPLLSLADRVAVLSACTRLVDHVVINTGDEDSKPAIAASGCDVIVHGSDWHRGNGLLEQMGLTNAWLEDRGIALVTLPYTEWTSTTRILRDYDQRRDATQRAEAQAQMARDRQRAHWNHGIDQVPARTGAASVMDCRDLVDACRGLGVVLPLTHVVDVGCGTGRWASQSRGGYLGLDIAADAVAYARRAGLNAVQIEGPGDVGPVLESLDRVDWVCCFSVFTHIGREDRQAYLRAFARRARNLLVDIIPGDGEGTIGLWTADWDAFLEDLHGAGWMVATLPYDRVSPDYVTHRYVWARTKESA